MLKDWPSVLRLYPQSAHLPRLGLATIKHGVGVRPLQFMVQYSPVLPSAL